MVLDDRVKARLHPYGRRRHVRRRDRDPRRTGLWGVKSRKELTFHIDSLFFAEGRAELLHLGRETTLGVSSGERVMMCGVGPGWWKRMIERGCNRADALD